jgi:hypothetical protein
MAKVSSGRSKSAKRADSESYLTVLPTPELPYETESADRIYSRQTPSAQTMFGRFGHTLASPC